MRGAMCLRLLLACALCSMPAFATHFRGGRVDYAVREDGLSVDFTLTAVWRSSFIGSADFVVLDTDGTSELHRTFVDWRLGNVTYQGSDKAGEQYSVIEAYHNYTFPRKATFSAEYYDCCRIHSLVNAGGTSFSVPVEIDLVNGPSQSPSIRIPPIVQLPVNQDPVVLDLNAVAGQAPDIGCTYTRGSGISVPTITTPNTSNVLNLTSPPCTLVWNTMGGDLAEKYALQVLYEDSVGNGTSAIEFIIELVNSTAQPIIWGSSFETQITAYVGATATASLSYSTPSGNNATFTTQPTLLPPNLVFSPSPDASSTLSGQGTVEMAFQPDVSQLNAGYSINLIISDAVTNAQSIITASIYVSTIVPPSMPPSPPPQPSPPRPPSPPSPLPYCVHDFMLDTHVGSSEEPINVELQFGSDLGSGTRTEIRVTVSLDAAAQSGTEDIVGLAIGNMSEPAPSGLLIYNVTTSTMPGATEPASTTEPSWLIDYGAIDQKTSLPNGLEVEGFDGTQTPYDLVLATNEAGPSDGIVQKVSFVLSSPFVDIVHTLLENTKWFVRLQHTNGGSDSAKTLGQVDAIEPCYVLFTDPPAPPFAPAEPAAPPPDPALGSCENPERVSLALSGEALTAEAWAENVNTCMHNSHRGSFTLNGRDYTFLISAADTSRRITVETRPPTFGGSYDTYLFAVRECIKNHEAGSWIASDDDGGQTRGNGDSYSRMVFHLPAGEEMFIIVTGFGYSCGKSDVRFTASLPPPPPPSPPPVQPAQPPLPPQCGVSRASAPNNGIRKICSIHNDPHVSTFSNVKQTCATAGSMTLLDNEHLLVTAEGVELDFARWNEATRGASVITNVSVIYKDSLCGGSTTLGGADEEVWEDERLSTKITSTRYVMFNGQPYLSIRIITPWTEGTGMCVDGCPVGDEIYTWFTNRRRHLLQGGSANESQAVQQATEQCEQQQLDESFLESCIFDIVATNDSKSFLHSSTSTSMEVAQEQREVDAENRAYRATFSPPPPPEASCADNQEQRLQCFITFADMDFRGNGTFAADLETTFGRGLESEPELSSYITHGGMCPSFVEAKLDPSSNIAALTIDLGNSATKDNVTSMEASLQEYNVSAVESILLAGLGYNLTVTGFSLKDPREGSSSEQSTSSRDIATVLGPAIAIPVGCVLIVGGVVAYYMVMRKKKQSNGESRERTYGVSSPWRTSPTGPNPWTVRNNNYFVSETV